MFSFATSDSGSGATANNAIDLTGSDDETESVTGSEPKNDEEGDDDGNKEANDGDEDDHQDDRHSDHDQDQDDDSDDDEGDGYNFVNVVNNNQVRIHAYIDVR